MSWPPRRRNSAWDIDVSRSTVIYDACVLYSAPLRDLLMHVALLDICSARWSDEIHEEWISALLSNRPELTRQSLERTRDNMNRHVRDCLVSGYESLISGIQLPDDRDRHVVAAAIVAGAETILTFNLKDFPQASLDTFKIKAEHPDEFLERQFDQSALLMCEAMRRHRASLQFPPKSVEEYLTTLQAQGLPRTVSCARRFSSEI